ncbi:MAG: hypothetical protein NT166_25285 [Candidatus Aminicenantes bacterium]|nr:hypothetical protein [Candidatus Aminicenantes bacterium]
MGEQQEKRIDFEGQVKKSSAVINVSLDYLYNMIAGKSTIYSTYQLQTEGEARDFVRSEFDKERLGIEGTLFGSYGSNIRYAAMSLDGSGLKSYGDYTIILSDESVRLRTTLLEENSYSFIRRHKILAGDKIPKGYRAVWKERYKLAIAKLMGKILLTKETDYAIIVLKSTGDRKRDEYIEVHIYGKINKEAIRAVRGNSNVDPGQKEKILRIKEYLKIYKKEWIEE